MRVDNAVIMAAGTSSRFAPLSQERPKALIDVRGERLIERQIRQLQDAGIPEVIIVTGYMADQFSYLKDKFGVTLRHNPDYLIRNNHSSIWQVRDKLRNTYICSADNYFTENPFRATETGPYYAAVYADGPTNEWCLTEDPNGRITSVTIGGRDSWYMLGHALWDDAFSDTFLKILTQIYDEPETQNKLWEAIYKENLDQLSLTCRHYSDTVIFEFDTLEELRQFDPSYIDNPRSTILEGLANALDEHPSAIQNIQALSPDGFIFTFRGVPYFYHYQTRNWTPYDPSN